MVYASSKKKLAASLGVMIDFHTFPAEVSEGDIFRLVPELNFDPQVHGILVEMPLPPQINANKFLSLIEPLKDVDGSHVVNRGRLLRGEDVKGTLFPVTPLSCLALLKSAGADPSGKKVTIIGRGETVGLPLAVMLIRMSATVTVCHTKTLDLKSAIKEADIVVTACGVPGLVTPDYLRPGQIVIDAGISYLPGGGVAGDTDPAAAKVVSYLSPVPGGVGSLTGILLMRNLIKALKLQSPGSF